MELKCNYKTEQTECPYFVMVSYTSNCGFLYKMGKCVAYRRLCKEQKKALSNRTSKGEQTKQEYAKKKLEEWIPVYNSDKNIYMALLELPESERGKVANSFFVTKIYGDSTHCPSCKSDNLVLYDNEKMIFCLGCRTTVYWRSGTVFYRTKISLDIWFFLIKRIYENRNVTTTSLSKEFHNSQWGMWGAKRRIVAALDNGQLAWLTSEIDEFNKQLSTDNYVES